MSKEFKNTKPWTCAIEDLHGENIIETFYKKELQKTKKKYFYTEKTIKKKSDKLNIKWKRYNNSFNNLVNKRDIII